PNQRGFCRGGIAALTISRRRKVSSFTNLILRCDNRFTYFQSRRQFKGSVTVQRVTVASPENGVAEISAETGDSFYDINHGQEPPGARPIRHFDNLLQSRCKQPANQCYRKQRAPRPPDERMEQGQDQRPKKRVGNDDAEKLQT